MNNNVKSATVAGLLGIFLGSVGAHDWYLGDKKKGIIHVCLAASGLVVSIIASVILPATLSFRAMLSMASLIAILDGIAAIVMGANGIWGLVEGIQILVQGDAGLAKKGYAVAQPNMGYGNGYNNQPMNNFGGQQNMNGMNNMNNANNMNNGQMNGNGNMNNNMNNGQMNGNGNMNNNMNGNANSNMNENNQMNQNAGNDMNTTNNTNNGNGGNQNGQ